MTSQDLYGITPLFVFGATVFVAALYILAHTWLEDRRQQRLVHLAELMTQAATSEARDFINRIKKGLGA